MRNVRRISCRREGDGAVNKKRLRTLSRLDLEAGAKGAGKNQGQENYIKT